MTSFGAYFTHFPAPLQVIIAQSLSPVYNEHIIHAHPSVDFSFTSLSPFRTN